ncbi:hypothetical protein J3A83DRAFT_4080094, partial [Scleroderma citrinum]
IIVFTCHDVLTHEKNTISYLLLHCLHAYIEYHLYTVFELHTSHTLATFNTLIWVCVQLIYCVFVNLLCLGQRYAEKTANISEKNWNFPKNHLGIHVFDDIEAKGVTCNFNTKPNEKMHGPIKEA